MGRHRLGEAGCTNSRSIPYAVLDFIRSQTMQSEMLRATASQKLTVGERRQIEIDGELTELHKQESNAVALLVKYGEVASITAELEKVMGSIKKLEQERALLNVAPSQDALSDMVDMGNILMEDDQQRLNALLQGAGYSIACEGSTVTVGEERLLTGGVHQVYEYRGSHCPTEAYRLIENSHTEHHLDMPNSKRVAAESAAFLEQEARYESGELVQQHLQWNGEAFIDVATGLVVEAVTGS